MPTKEQGIEDLQALIDQLCGREHAVDLAEILLNRYGSLSSLVESIRLYRGAPTLPDSLKLLLAMTPHLCRMRLQDRMGPQPKLDTLAAASQYAASIYIGAQYEQLKLLCLNQEYRLIDCLTISEGGLREVSMYPRRILQEALNAGAQAIMICHNHPSGWRFFSEADIAATRSLLALCTRMQLTMLDHLLSAGAQVISMRCHPLMPEKEWNESGPMMPPIAQWRGRLISGVFLPDTALDEGNP